MVLNIFFTMPRLSQCLLFQALVVNKKKKQKYCWINILIKFSMLYSGQGLVPPGNLLTPGLKTWLSTFISNILRSKLSVKAIPFCFSPLFFKSLAQT